MTKRNAEAIRGESECVPWNTWFDKSEGMKMKLFLQKHKVLAILSGLSILGVTSIAAASLDVWGSGVQCSPVSTHEWCAQANTFIPDNGNGVYLTHWGTQTKSSSYKVRARVKCCLNSSCSSVSDWRYSAWSTDAGGDLAFVGCADWPRSGAISVMLSRQ